MKKFSKGEILSHEGEIESHFFILIEGEPESFKGS